MSEIWFGTLHHAEYIPAPESGMEASSVGVTETLVYDNGGAFVANSAGSHREFEMDWAVNSIDSLDILSEIYDGLHDTKLCYWVDPFAKNALPPHWAAPMLTGKGWPSLYSPSVQPELVEAPVTAMRLPPLSARYTIEGYTPYEKIRKLTLLIPHDKDLHIGFMGSATGVGVYATPILPDGTEDATVELKLIAPNATSNNQTNATFIGGQHKAVRIYISGKTVVGGTMNLVAGNAHYVDRGAGPTYFSKFVRGTGHTGLLMTDAPTTVYIQRTRRRALITRAVQLMEVEAWL